MIRYMYYDHFTNEYCRPSKKELGIAPPERYLRTLPNVGGDYYVEHWKVSGSSLGDRLDVCYRYTEYANTIRHQLEKRNDCTLQYIIWWEIPVSKFNEYAKRFGLVKELKRKNEQPQRSH